MLLIALFAAGCTRTPETARARNLLLVTIDTLRADHVGAYGYTRARTPRLDALATNGAIFARAYAAAPITLPSHATLLSGRYPPGHGARDNGLKVSEKTPTLATELKARGFRTAAFVAAFPLDHQFGLSRGFDVYSDRLPRDRSGRLANERPAADVINEAIAWLNSEDSAPFFLWVHLFEPHAPYAGDLSRPVTDRYDDEVATADRELGRLLDALGARTADTLIVVAGDHGEAFGEHGEYAHSIFIYDTTLQVPLMMVGRGVTPRRIPDAVTLADVAPTVARLLLADGRDAIKDVDGIDVSPAFGGEPLPARELYAESFAPLVEFGWAPLRSVRSGAWKYIAAPRPELYDLSHDSAEQQNVFDANTATAKTLSARADKYAGDALDNSSAANGEAAQRLRALGYSSGSIRNPHSALRNDPKDRRELAAQLARVTSGELRGAALVSALETIVREDPRNGQAHLRLGFARVEAGDCARAEPEFHAAVASGLPGADPYLGLAGCLGARRDLDGAEQALNEALRLEPDNPVVLSNIGILKATRGDMNGAIRLLSDALMKDPDLLEARFNLALALAQAGKKSEAIQAATEVLQRLPADAPQRSEVERFLRVLKGQ
ncbi:MAG TPA: sulfatase-like hydrolase/transferase [Candidatus Cybelea sp.]|nr:sulfatase-like hydrolase/transferase [Candidatus Cybelea sp.]